LNVRFRPKAGIAVFASGALWHNNGCVRSPASLVLIACVALAVCAEDSAVPVPHRIVAIGDIHADIGAARAAFQLAGATNDHDEWIGGDLVVVQLGDIIGRSYEDRDVLDFILDLRKKARAAGGQLHSLIGNHEVFGARLRLDYVAADAYSAFDDIPGLVLDDPRLAHLAADQRARGAALMAGGHYAKQLAEFSTVLRLGDTIYVHGGVTPHWANYGVNRINKEVSQWFAGSIVEPLSAQGVDAGNFDDIVIMSRHFSDDVDEEDCELLEESLAILGAKRMVVAHTVQESITARCDEQVWAIDVAMSRFYGGQIQVLEIIDDEKLTIIRE